MGYSYCGGLLCCDVCGDTGGVRKHKCPFGWCPKVALCPKCKREHPEYLTKSYHREHGNCEENHLRFERQKAKELQLLNEGKLLRRSALQHKTKTSWRIKVIFRGLFKEGKEQIIRAFWMAPRTYRAIELGVPASVEDYKALGKVTRARNADIYDAEKYAEWASK